MTSCFHTMEQKVQNKKTTRMFRPVHQVATPGSKSAVSDCICFSLLAHCLTDLRAHSALLTFASSRLSPANCQPELSFTPSPT